MNLAELSVKRPVFITCIFGVILLLGLLSYGKLSTELYPDVSFPVVNIVVPLPGAGPEEVENQISKPLENALSGIAGLRSIRSSSIQGAGIVTSIFTLDSDIKVAEQKVTQALARVRGDFPSGTLEPSVRTIDPSDVPLMTLGFTAKVPEDKLFELADREIRPRLQEIPKVGLVEIEGGRKREIEVDVDREKLLSRQMTLGEIVNRVGLSGMNIPSGEIENSGRSTLVRSVAQFDSLGDLARLPIRFVPNQGVTHLSDVAQIRDGLSDESNRVYVTGKKAIALKIYRQKGGDNLSIARDLVDEVKKINAEYSARYPDWNMSLVHDGTKPVKAGVNEAKQAIELGIALTILVVFFFLGNLRSTLITGIALPNSIFGAFLLMWVAGFSMNITTFAALSLAVGLLIDDAIVVRESIFKRLEAGDAPDVAAVRGTKEVTLAVVATTFTVLSVFGPIAFLNGIIGQFFKEFGFTICFAMLISLLDSLTMAPMLSAYFAGKGSHTIGVTVAKKNFISGALAVFEKYQNWQERFYIRVLKRTIHYPGLVILSAIFIFAMSLLVFNHIPKSFIPPAGAGEFQVLLDTPPGTSLPGTDKLATLIDQTIRNRVDVESTVLSVGGDHGESNLAKILVLLKDRRNHSTIEVKEEIREQLKPISGVNVAVQDIIDVGGGAGQPFTLNITGQNLNEIRTVALNLAEALKKGGDLRDVDTSYRNGASELKIKLDPAKGEALGVSSTEVGQELRLMLSGFAPAHFHAGGEQYDVRVRLKEDQRDLKKDFNQIYVPNLNHRLLALSSIAKAETDESPSNIRRENRKRYIELSADVDSHGLGLSHAVDFTRNWFSSQGSAIPAGVSYEFAGQTRDFQDLLKSGIVAVGLSVIFMYLVLASLYESFFIPLNIMLVLPLAVCGAFYALKLTGSAIEINSMIGCILLLGVSAKNSILLVDHIQNGFREGMALKDAILEAGQVRLRPIMMTSFALIAGMLPVAIPLEEAARQRAGMAIAVIGGLVTSTLLTLIVVPAMYPFLLKFEKWVKGFFQNHTPNIS